MIIILEICLSSTWYTMKIISWKIINYMAQNLHSGTQYIFFLFKKKYKPTDL